MKSWIVPLRWSMDVIVHLSVHAFIHSFIHSLSLIPDGLAQNTSLQRNPRGIVTSSPNHFKWLLSMCRNSGSSPSVSWIAERDSVSQGASSHPAEEIHFGCLFLWSHSCTYYPRFMTVGEIRNVDWRINRGPCLGSAPSSLQQSSTESLLHQRWQSYGVQKNFPW